MKKQNYILNILLAAVVGVTMLIFLLCRTFQPAVVLPVLNIPNLLALSVIALVLEYYLAPEARRCRICSALLAAATFGLLPWAAGVAGASEIWKLALAGGLVFAAADWLFQSMAERIRSAPLGKAAAIAAGLVLILAGQCFAGMLL